MKIRNPKSRFDLKINKDDFVLDVGGGNNPYPQANVVVDKHPFTNYHRSGNLKILKKQKFVAADGENLPFKNKEFDYVICCHVLEHSEDPSKFLSELSRVGRKGYIEVPSLIGEYLIPKKSHRWVILELDEKVVLMDKKDIGFNPSIEFGDLFQKHLIPNSIEFRILIKTYPDLFTVRYEWRDEIDFIVGPQDPKLHSFFTSSWDKEKIEDIIRNKSKFKQIVSFLSGLTGIVFDFIKSKL